MGPEDGNERTDGRVSLECTIDGNLYKFRRPKVGAMRMVRPIFTAAALQSPAAKAKIAAIAERRGIAAAELQIADFSPEEQEEWRSVSMDDQTAMDVFLDHISSILCGVLLYSPALDTIEDAPKGWFRDGMSLEEKRSAIDEHLDLGLGMQLVKHAMAIVTDGLSRQSAARGK